MMPPVTLFRYMAARAIQGVGGLLLVLVCIILLVDLIENLRFVGKTEAATFSDAILLTLLRTPSLAQTLAPFVFLFGSIWMFYQLNKRSELAVMRSMGLSVWRLIGPAGLIAALAGFAIITAIDPLASRMLAYAETHKAQAKGEPSRLIKVFSDGIWLRQRNENANVIINAKSHDRETGRLTDVTIWRFNASNAFLERIDAKNAQLQGATLELYDATLTALDRNNQRTTDFYALETSLSVDDLNERVQSPETVSLWRLQKFINLAEAAGLPTTRYQIRFHDLCSTPLKLLAMVLIAAAFSMRPHRTGGQMQLVILSIGAGFVLYLLSEISTAMGESEIAPIALAAWTPAVVATLAAISMILYLEEG